jgi:hypothetical protein
VKFHSWSPEPASAPISELRGLLHPLELEKVDIESFRLIIAARGHGELDVVNASDETMAILSQPLLPFLA